MHEPLNLLRPLIGHCHDVARAVVIDLMEILRAQCLGTAGAVNHMGDILHGGAQARPIANGTIPNLHLWQVGFDETPVAGRAEEHRCGDALSAKTVQNVAADKSVGPGE